MVQLPFVDSYYNLSVKGRNKWDGRNTAKLPVETQRHIANARFGAKRAGDYAMLDAAGSAKGFDCDDVSMSH